MAARQDAPLRVTSAQLRAARAYLDGTMAQAAETAGSAKRMVFRLERNERRAASRPASLRSLVRVDRERHLLLEGGGVTPQPDGDDGFAGLRPPPSALA